MQDKINIYINEKFYKEKDYASFVLFNTILGIDYDIHLHSEDSYKICFDNSCITLIDTFFSALSENNEYYNNANNIPETIVKHSYPFFDIKDIPIIYGNDSYTFTENTAHLGLDIFASAFFMLSRWEEIAIKDRDKHNRFLEAESLSIKHNFNESPIVNMYADLLWALMQKLGCSAVRKDRKYKLYLTHDIDDFARYDKFGKFIKALGGDLIKRKSLHSFFNTISDYFAIKFNGRLDNYDKFDFLMNASESVNNVSRFYFIPGKVGETDVRFDIDMPKVNSCIENIINKDHVVGIHPSYDTYNNSDMFKQELNRLLDKGCNIKEGRQHYLRFENPSTWNIWEQHSLKTDSSIGFYEHIGFRAGICNEYPVFDVVNRKMLRLIERPLIVMDTALRRISKNSEDAINICTKVFETVSYYKGDFVLLWHNSNLSCNEWKSWDRIYLDVLQIIKDK